MEVWKDQPVKQPEFQSRFSHQWWDDHLPFLHAGWFDEQMENFIQKNSEYSTELHKW